MFLSSIHQVMITATCQDAKVCFFHSSLIPTVVGVPCGGSCWASQFLSRTVAFHHVMHQNTSLSSVVYLTFERAKH